MNRSLLPALKQICLRQRRASRQAIRLLPWTASHSSIQTMIQKLQETKEKPVQFTVERGSNKFDASIQAVLAGKPNKNIRRDGSIPCSGDWDYGARPSRFIALDLPVAPT